MQDYKNVEISEIELEDLIRQATHLIEDELQYIDHQKTSDRGRLDVLMVDSGQALVVAELKVCEDDSMLMQGVDYYDYLARNIEGISRAYKQFKISPTQTPRLFLIAPSFSVNLLNRCKWIDIPISAFAYTCLKFEGSDEKIPVFTEVTIPTLPEPVKTHSLKDRLSYITSLEMRELATKVLEEIQCWDSSKILIEPLKYDISLKCSGRVFAYLAPRRKSFQIYTFDTDSVWTGYRINDMKDFKGIEPLLRTNMRR